ncbi:transporter suffix domain-containing protein [Bacillus sp. T33-2]|uniref:transporter suffix domain-containing protein n=1 Tax=Bacillus sp. T33-2 TaxID=2054168 RepID=UPI000C7721B3|nr:transporter suffix domain-containing protein [Bacillus sp. T33-2]PLR96932.1 hypothetical protein CVD19_10115 [Bacillus sp. T33-2]
MDQGSGKTVSKKMRYLAIGLIVASFIFYLLIPAAALLPFAAKTKLVLSGVLAVMGEVSFWVGGFILGKEAVKKYRKYFNPARWFKK